MTTRKGFFAMLLGAAGLKAAQGFRWNPEKGDWERSFTNGECPVCGTMAEPFVPARTLYCADSQVYNPMTGESMSGCDWDLRPGQSRLTRCKHCNAAFWQDAEEPNGIRKAPARK